MNPGKVNEFEEQSELDKYDLNYNVFSQQEHHLKSIPKKQLEEIFVLYDKIKAEGYCASLMYSETFNQLHEKLYEQKLIFNFDWREWESGFKIINDIGFDYSGSSLLDISMYLTVIFRSERFIDGNIECNFKNGTLDKIFTRFKELEGR